MKNGLGVVDLCKHEGIELRGTDGQPFHCGVRMNVQAGLFGVDYAKCLTCGLTIGNVLSPHINGGLVMEAAAYDDDLCWFRLDEAKP